MIYALLIGIVVCLGACYVLSRKVGRVDSRIGDLELRQKYDYDSLMSCIRTDQEDIEKLISKTRAMNKALWGMKKDRGEVKEVGTQPGKQGGKRVCVAPMSTTFATRLKNIRMRKRLSQVQHAKMVGVTQRAVSNWELGYGISQELLESLAKALNVDSRYLMYGTGDAPTADKIASINH